MFKLRIKEAPNSEAGFAFISSSHVCTDSHPLSSLCDSLCVLLEQY